ncbi:hypothetical protein [Streptomyces xanthophaeus]|uniref:hypothetical protein n=1 Tax=Streptomyces xanthophaeus TaxID=67385 RepID=UPI002648DB7F|nr:hypothetical protein [Streptomyces xanthophaeus]WKD33318.1 hypothetical protein KO717_16025 [Streptomyces xanthophaeus]
MDLSDGGSPFDADVIGMPVADVAGLFPGRRSAADLAAFFVRAGWSSRSSSWEGYEVESPLARLEIEPVDAGVLLRGEADAGRLDALTAVLSARGLPFSVEFYGEDGALLREVREVCEVRVGPADLAGPAGPRQPDLPVRPRQGLRQRLTDLFTRKG